MKKIKVIIADDHQIVIDGLKSLLVKEEHIEIVGEALNGNEVLDIVSKQEVDIAILDIEMPLLSGIEATKIIKKDFPNVKVLILSMYNTEKFVHSVIEIGADGYILKNKGKEELALAIKYIADGDEFFGREVEKTFRLSQKKKNDELKNIKLTKREIDVLKLIATGDTTPIISDKLCIAHSTVETHRRNLIEKTGVKGGSKGLVKYAFENGYI
ncbi:response regulator transcription factor [Aquimarina litoralis]|uniref:response regulator transcription factor n=1 Tax=Aquimarina litoralis TaxID=584605 RepID=UPI001C56A72E|nr:response regulator transcription factor [Aquimarina litoralis]MBW1295415.1 response regulator [Aquimarina litoralis]